jgi:hypothetical protein
VIGDLSDPSDFEFMTLSSDGGVFFDATVPGEAGSEVGKSDPGGLNEEAAN